MTPGRIAACLLPTLLLAGCGARGSAGAHPSDVEAQIIAAAIRQLVPTISEDAAREDAVIVLDPTLVLGRYGPGGPVDSARAARVAALTRVRVATLDEVSTCPAQGSCRLNAAAAFRFGTPAIRGDTATVNAVIWFAGKPEWRDQRPVTALEVVLVRSASEWVLRERRLLMES